MDRNEIREEIDKVAKPFALQLSGITVLLIAVILSQTTIIDIDQLVLLRPLILITTGLVVLYLLLRVMKLVVYALFESDDETKEMKNRIVKFLLKWL